MQSFSPLEEICSHVDSDGSGALDVREFELCMNHMGLFFKKQELVTLFKTFDADGNGTIRWQDFASALRVPLDSRRSSIIDKAWSKVGGPGEVPMSKLSSSFLANDHPLVVDQLSTAEEMLDQLILGLSKEYVTEEDFRSYYTEYSSCVPDADCFVEIVEGSWGIKEDDVLPIERQIDRYERELVKKLGEKTRGNETPDKVLDRYFRHFDTDESGYITPEEFKRAVERFGLSLDDPALLRGFFNRYDKDGSGRLSFREFMNALNIDRA